MKNKLNVLLRGSLFSVTFLFLSTFYLTTSSFTAQASVIPTVPHIYVEGTSEFGIYPDQIKITVSLSDVNLDVEIAKSVIDDKSLRLFEAVKKLKIEPKDITATPLQISPVFEYEDGKRIKKGTQVNRNVDITLKNLEKYSLLNDVLVKAGITSKISSVVEVSNEGTIKKKALMLALEDAKQKAQSLAELQNKTIKGVHSISEFKTRKDNAYTLKPDQVIYGQTYSQQQRHRAAAPLPAIFEIGEMRVTATVYVVYTIE